ncbi:MAG TPA: pyridoxamine 5'-phosphate oxidase family protein [Acidimicrobiia bacterium]|nr:pyridoxamine 5'-phosphate oxidase family protein [Acidimicrobiia bacterium]
MASDKTRIRRLPELAVEGLGQIESILDEGFICHVAYLMDDRPVVIPTLYARDGGRVLLHGSPASGLMLAVKRGSPLSVAVTLVDGLVVARSGFESSANYRSVVIHGNGRLLDGDEHERGLDVLVEALIPGRLADIRRPTTKELRKTAIIAVGLDEVSAKVHAGPPEDSESDLGTGVWAGVVPFELAAGAPLPAPDLEPGVDIPDYLTRYRRS